MGSEMDRLLAAGLSRRDILRAAGVFGGSAAFLAACGEASSTVPGGGSETAMTHPPLEEEPGGLKVFDWSGYGNGDYYPDEEKEFLWGDYAKATGDTPVFALFENDDAGYTEVAAGARYDVIHPCGYRWQDWVDLGVMQPWDTSLIPNASALNPKLLASGQIDGEQYFIPLDWGFIAPLVNTDHVELEEESFGILFDDRYADKISWVDTLNMMVVAGYFLQIPNPWDMTDDELGQVRDFLISKKHLVKFLWSQSYDFWLAFKKEEVWIGYAWPDTVGYADAKGMNYRYLEPKEGRISWVCGLGLMADSPNYRHAHAYADSWASTKAAEFLLAYYYYGHTNTEVDISSLPAGVVEALALDDPSVLEEPRSHPETHIPRRDVYSQYWGEVLAS
ncbi:MAG: extracellular solute-binding protein [Actinomycetota bacterium]